MKTRLIVYLSVGTDVVLSYEKEVDLPFAPDEGQQFNLHGNGPFYVNATYISVPEMELTVILGEEDGRDSAAETHAYWIDAGWKLFDIDAEPDVRLAMKEYLLATNPLRVAE